MKHTQKHYPEHLELIPIQEPEQTETQKTIKYRSYDGCEFEYPPIPAHVLKDDPTAYRSLDGTICTHNPLKTVYYTEQKYLSDRFKKRLENNPSKATLDKAEEKRIRYLLTQYEPMSKEHDALLDALKKRKEIDADRKVQPATVISAATSLAGILAVINHERIGYISTKAFNLVTKPRVQ